jgi:tetratricopeptide (TPR) repeat protein
MTMPGMIQPPETNPFDERIDILSSELELAIKWDRPAALLAIYNSEYVRADAETALENFLVEQGQKIIHIKMDDMPDFNLVSLLQLYPAIANHIFFVHGLKKPFSEQTNIFLKLSHHIDILLKKKIRIIFWLTQNVATDMLRAAPDFWEFRQCIVEFIDSPKPDQILQNAIESVWQGIGEYAEQFEDTDDKISMRETFLTDLPKSDEATSTRANLLLTLGILNWRKGDFEKANELLQDAIKSAAKLEDTFFEAECFNAIALVYFSQGKNDEAVAAYKQAIAIAPDQIFVWNNLGNLCMKIMRNDEAMLAFQKALKHNDKDPVAWNGLGTVYYSIGYIDDSIAAYRKAIEYAPTLAHPWNGLGDAYLSVGRDLEAIAAYQNAIKLNKQLITSWLRLADIYCRQGRNKDAIKTYQRALDVSPNNHQIWNELGSTFLRINSFEEAAQAFAKAIELDRSFGWAYSNLAVAYAHQGNYFKAIDLCYKSLSIFTEDHDKSVAWDRLASYYRAINDYDNAVEAYQTADRLNGHLVTSQPKSASDSPMPAVASHAESRREVALIEKPIANIHQDYQVAPKWAFQSETWSQNISMSNPCEENLPPSDEQLVTEQKTEESNMSTFFSHPILRARSAPENSKKQFPTIPFENEEEIADTKNPAVWNEKGNIHFRNGDYEHAIIAYNKAIEFDRSFGWSYSNLALTYLALGRYAEAILLYQKSICLLNTKEEKAASWNSLGNIYRHLNNYKDALDAYQSADEVDPQNAGRRDRTDFAYAESNSQNAQVWIELGNLFFKAASYIEAFNAYTQAINIDPASGWAHSNLAMSLAYQGKYTDAILIYKKSIDLFTNGKDKAVSWNRLGNIYRRLNDYDNAKKAYQNAVELSDEKASLLTRTRFSLLGNCYSN